MQQTPKSKLFEVHPTEYSSTMKEVAEWKNIYFLTLEEEATKKKLKVFVCAPFVLPHPLLGPSRVFLYPTFLLLPPELLLHLVLAFCC